MFPELYHAHHNRYLEDLPFWLDLASQAAGPILELGCGTGRVLIPLMEAGFNPIGLDLNLGMLVFLKANHSLDAMHAPRLVCADMSRFNLAKQFSLIILPCNTFSTLTENQRKASLKCIRRHLQPGGIFALSLPNPEVMMQLPARSIMELEDEFIHPLTGNPVQVSSGWRRSKDAFTVTWKYDHFYPDGTAEHVMVKAKHCLNSFEGYASEIKDAGMSISQVYGDFDRAIYTPESPNLIIVAAG